MQDRAFDIVQVGAQPDHYENNAFEKDAFSLAQSIFYFQFPLTARKLA